MNEMNAIDVQINRIKSHVREAEVDGAALWLAFSEYAHRESAKVLGDQMKHNNKISMILDIVAGIVTCGALSVFTCCVAMI